MPVDTATRGNDRAAITFVARLGAAMAASDYPVSMIHDTMSTASRAYGLDSEILVLPNYIHVGGKGGEDLYIADTSLEMRFDQTTDLAAMVAQVHNGSVRAAEGIAELDRIAGMPRRYPAWVAVVGYAVQVCGLALSLQPTPLSLAAASLMGLVVGAVCVVGRRSGTLTSVLPAVCAFIAALSVFLVHRHLHMGSNILHALAPPLSMLVPGAAITLAVFELSGNHAVYGASRVAGGFMQLAQLAFGILLAAEVAGVADTDLLVSETNRVGAWAAWAGVVLYGLGAMLYLGPRLSFLPWMLLMLLLTYGAQWFGNVVIGSYASGFAGGFVLMLSALAISHRPSTPPTAALMLPGFWLLVPGSLGFMGVTEMLGTQSSSIFTATVVAMLSIAMGMQAGDLLWQAVKRVIA